MGKTGSSAPPAQDRYLVPGLVRGLEVLQAFTPERRVLTLGDLAAELGVTRSAAFRVAYTLAELGFLTHDPRARSYMLGPAILRLGHGAQASRALVETALPALRKLRDQSGWSAHLGVREEREVLYLLRLPTRRGLISIVRVGTRLPAHATSMGRVLLAGLAEADVAALYRDVELATPGLRGPGTLAALLRRHRQDRRQDTILQNGGFEAGVASVAAPIRDAAGQVVAAINASTADPGMRSSAVMEQVARRVLATAGVLSARFRGEA